MFSLTKSYYTRTHGTTDGDAQDVDFGDIHRVWRIARTLTAEILVITLVAFIWVTSVHRQVLYGCMVGGVAGVNGDAVPGGGVAVVELGARATTTTRTEESVCFCGSW